MIWIILATIWLALNAATAAALYFKPLPARLSKNYTATIIGIHMRRTRP